MTVDVIYTKKSVKDLKKLDKKVAQKIIKKIKFFSEKEDYLSFAKKLNFLFDDLYRFRIGVYRVIFEINKNNKITLFIILKVSHRKDIYS